MVTVHTSPHMSRSDYSSAIRLASTSSTPRRALVIHIFDGSNGQDAFGFDLDRELFASNDFAVLAVNCREPSRWVLRTSRPFSPIGVTRKSNTFWAASRCTRPSDHWALKHSWSFIRRSFMVSRFPATKRIATIGIWAGSARDSSQKLSNPSSLS